MLRALRQCKVCTVLIRDISGYCEDHKHLKVEVNRIYNKSRDKRTVVFYNSIKWKRVRQSALIRDKGLCQHCLRKGKITMSDMVHHIVEIRIDWSMRLVLGNLISLCDSCHSKVDHKR